jgi:methionyl-tRNA synthetase
MEARLEVDCRGAMDEYREFLSRMEFRKAVFALRRLWSLGNSYIDARAPWNLLKTDRDEAAMVLRICVNLVRVFALASEPVIPYAAGVVMNALGLTGDERQVRLVRS